MMRELTARQFVRLRERAGLSQAKLATLLKVHHMTISKWENERQPIPYTAQIALRCIANECEHALAGVK